MPVAFMLLTLALGPVEEVLRILSGIPNVKDTHVVIGNYDIMTTLEADSIETLQRIAWCDIGKIAQVRSSLILYVMNAS